MRVDFTSSGVESPETRKTGQAWQAEASGTEASGGAGSASASAPASTLGLDQASFSFDQTRVQSLAVQALAQPEVRQAKVQALQQALSGGEYSVSPGQVADALVGDVGSEAWG